MKCNEIATFRFTWPGRDESYACMPHARQILGAAEAMGFHLQMIPMGYHNLDEVKHCQQELKKENGSKDTNTN